MPLTRGVVCALLVMFVVAGSPSRVFADGFLTPYVGSTFEPSAGAGGDEDDDDDGLLDDNRFTYGVGLGSMGNLVGFEVDFANTPEFFGESDDFGDNNVTTLMLNLLVGGGTNVRPYVTGGVGLLKLRLDGPRDLFDFNSNDLGMDLGFGVMGFFGGRAGLRGDLRYFRNLTDVEPDGEIDLDLGDFTYWRGTIGLAFRY